jgi:hypothetical protein
MGSFRHVEYFAEDAQFLREIEIVAKERQKVARHENVKGFMFVASRKKD